MKTKAELLEHYATKEPKQFYQADGFYTPEMLEVKPRSRAIPVDSDGDSIILQATTELMTATWDVRVMIPESTSKETAIRMLEKIKKNIERDGLLPELQALNATLNRHIDRIGKLRIVGKEKRHEVPDEIPF